MYRKSKVEDCMRHPLGGKKKKKKEKKQFKIRKFKFKNDIH